LLALFKFRRSAIQSCRTVDRSLIVQTIATLRQSPLPSLLTRGIGLKF
jgi:hypothetical protein